MEYREKERKCAVLSGLCRLTALVLTAVLLVYGAFGGGFGGIFGGALTVQAAQKKAIRPEAGRAFPEIGKTATVKVEYDESVGGFGNLAVVSSDPAVATASLEDKGKGRAVLTVQGVAFGTASVAVYQANQPEIAAYVAVYSGFAGEDGMYSAATPVGTMAVYDDCTVTWPASLTGKNGAALALTDVELEQNSGLDCLKVTGNLTAQDQKKGGLSAFYASFYDAGGGLIRRQAVYTANPDSYNEVELKWYLPKGCARVVLE
ncbi:MAG: hypothetical protein Q4C65_08055 [Eubacteriales bacterium]|nr:hypothetical protein [Eubacteriales bacterium]